MLYHCATIGDDNISRADVVPVFCFVGQSLARFTGQPVVARSCHLNAPCVYLLIGPVSGRY